jgi:uncharacterized membrane protein YphA (DoxX/SURF4 family)
MGLNGFLGFMPLPPMPEAAGEFMGALVATGYMIPLIKLTEIVAGLMLLSGRFVPLGLTLLAPDLVNIALFHAVLAPSGLIVAVVLLGLELYLAYSYRDVFRPLLSATQKTTDARAPQQRFAYHH